MKFVSLKRSKTRNNKILENVEEGGREVGRKEGREGGRDEGREVGKREGKSRGDRKKAGRTIEETKWERRGLLIRKEI